MPMVIPYEKSIGITGAAPIWHDLLNMPAANVIPLLTMLLPEADSNSKMRFRLRLKRDTQSCQHRQWSSWQRLLTLDAR